MAMENRPSDDFTGTWISPPRLDGGWHEVAYENGRPNGRFRRYLNNGVIHREGSMLNGLYHGEMIVRDSSGNVLDVSHFEHGTGIYRIFMSGGQLGWEIPIRNGKRHGLVKRFKVDGSSISVEEFVDDKRVS
jgi:antitoxin component YwqK of YwqJK toxin-antitoxin module